MTKLTWLIYFSQIVDNLDTAEAVFTTLFTLAALFVTTVAVAMFMNGDTEEENYPKIRLVSRLMMPYTFFCWMVCIVTPSQQTVILMVASQYANSLVNNPSFKGELLDPGIKLLQVWMQSETASLESSGSH